METNLNQTVKRIINEELDRILLEWERQCFIVRRMLEKPMSFERAQRTGHMRNDRTSRIDAAVDGAGEPLYSFLVDTGHPNGDEIHTVTERGLIIIQNARTKRIVTFLFARPKQITRYWEYLGLDLPKDPTFNLMLRFAENNLARRQNDK